MKRFVYSIITLILATPASAKVTLLCEESAWPHPTDLVLELNKEQIRVADERKSGGFDKIYSRELTTSPLFYRWELTGFNYKLDRTKLTLEAREYNRPESSDPWFQFNCSVIDDFNDYIEIKNEEVFGKPKI